MGTKVKDTEELKKEWEEFKARQRRAREEAMAQHRGIYQCKVTQQGSLQSGHILLCQHCMDSELGLAIICFALEPSTAADDAWPADRICMCKANHHSTAFLSTW